MNKKGIGRLNEVIGQVNDAEIKSIIEGVFRVEISYRSTDRAYFPRKKLNDVIEETARRIESNHLQYKIDEIPKD